MLILTIRTDNPIAELGLYEDLHQLAYLSWPAHRELAESIHLQIRQLLKSQNVELNSLQAVAVYKGPGSFTGLRIGLSVANALADSLKIPIVSGSGSGWIKKSITRIMNTENENFVLPEYGSPPNITPPKH